ncbi:hypothetical protein SAM23877_p058 (plasmid) [Streptomyces ambofaciens ATCC 23877]|uniref:Uncharacterized protein n=1 Tax=Streptomyces ambofaciens (strain ATCC 23877 / 3486 / DSM 40053 / JCM 4204 / NBRC 12836 / NRRL B-2516) TaxID=278992 RepID=A0A0K2B6R7_STRA7|nr:hypothetical protein [Streptomyces ambofaciens]AKZ60767.1 hypothetical protein SAM23877_p058 [Streptomyces ambofaciens ATCC 23877]
MADQAYVTELADELHHRHPDLVSAENDLAGHRRRLAIVVRFLHNEAIAHDIRLNLARDLHLPEPTR